MNLSPGKMDAQKLAHDRFEKLLQQNPLEGTKTSFSLAAFAKVKDQNLRQYINTLNIPCSNQHFWEQSSGGMRLVALDDGPTGDVQEKPVLFRKRDGQGNNLLVRACGPWSESLKKLICERNTQDLQGWLDYKLYQSIKNADTSYVKLAQHATPIAKTHRTATRFASEPTEKFENVHQYSSPKHHNTITKTSPQHHHPSLRHQSITDTEQRHHQHKTKASPTYHQNITTQSLHITGTRPRHHRHIT